METQISAKEKETILNDIVNDKVSLKIEQNDNSSFNVSFIDTATNKNVYDTYTIPYAKDVSNLNLAAASLLILNTLEPVKEIRSSGISSPNSGYFSSNFNQLDNPVTFEPENLIRNPNGGSSFVPTFYNENLEKIMSKISNSSHKLPALPNNDRYPGLYQFDDGSAIYFKRKVIGGSDGPADCGALLIATSNMEKLNEYLLAEYVGREKDLEKSFEDKKPNKVTEAIKSFFVKKEPKHKTPITFNAEKISQLREKFLEEVPGKQNANKM